MAVYGVDVSRHQGDIDWLKVKVDGITFAVLKFSQGVSYGYADWLRANLGGAQRAGLLTGGYLFLMQSSGGDAQGGYYVDRAAAVDGLHGAHIIDCETAPGPEYPDAAHVDAAAKRIKREIPGARVGMYTGRWYWGANGVIGNPPVPDSIDYVWESRYVVLGAEPWRTLAAGVPPTWFGANHVGGRPSEVLQVSSSARVAGIGGQVDLDAYPGTLAELHALTHTEADMSAVVDELLERLALPLQRDGRVDAARDALARRFLDFAKRGDSGLALSDQVTSALGQTVGRIDSSRQILTAAVNSARTDVLAALAEHPSSVLSAADRQTLSAAAAVLQSLATAAT